MKRYIVLSILAVSLMTAFAQEDAQKYRRRLYLFLDD